MSSMQRQVLPKLIDESCNMAIVCRTGAGKTLSAAMAAVQAVDINKQSPQVLFLCGSFEAALLTHATICRLAELKPIKIALIVKGHHGESNNVNELMNFLLTTNKFPILLQKFWAAKLIVISWLRRRKRPLACRCSLTLGSYLCVS